MYERSRQRQQKVYDIAQTDSIYQAWENSFAECREAFIRFAGDQPEEVRTILYGYAECGRMAQQRLLNLACQHMRFPDEE